MNGTPVTARVIKQSAAHLIKAISRDGKSEVTLQFEVISLIESICNRWKAMCFGIGVIRAKETPNCVTKSTERTAVLVEL